MPIRRRAISLTGTPFLLAMLLGLSACAGGGDIQPGTGAAAVKLGDSREVVEKILGKPVSSSGSGVHGSKTVETMYLLYPSHGIDVLLEGDKVRSIFLYNEGADDHKRYGGAGPAGVTLGSKRDEVLAALGDPSARGLGTEADLWFRYDSGLEVAFDREGTIHHLVVTRRH